ncbi:MAG: hypothetical protein B6229_03260 [Spirochaetaceae bacterium 4572_7]|nr:MAG: hypothetical protein B6229_03260 [Spirochaetaceae bacterium 4572_7]
MLNTLLFIGWVLIGLSGLLLSFRMFGKVGLIGVMAGSIVMMNILVTKSVFLFGLGATGGNVLYAMIFLATDILSEHFGGKEARKAVMIGFFVSVMMTVASWVTLVMIPAPWDWAHTSLATLITPMFRIVLGSMVAYLASNTLDTFTYDWLKKKFPKYLWIRNNGSTWTSQLLDSLIFCSIALLGVMPFSAWAQIVISTYIVKIVVAAMDTPFLYLSKRLVKKHPELLE